MSALRAYTDENRLVFEVPRIASQPKARDVILNHGMLAHVCYVIYDNQRYSIGKVYKWPTKSRKK